MQHLIEEIISHKPVWLASVCTYVFVFVLSTIVLNKHIPHIRKHTPTRAIHMRAHTHTNTNTDFINERILRWNWLVAVTAHLLALGASLSKALFKATAAVDLVISWNKAVVCDQFMTFNTTEAFLMPLLAFVFVFLHAYKHDHLNAFNSVQTTTVPAFQLNFRPFNQIALNIFSFYYVSSFWFIQFSV